MNFEKTLGLTVSKIDEEEPSVISYPQTDTRYKFLMLFAVKVSDFLGSLSLVYPKFTLFQEWKSVLDADARSENLTAIHSYILEFHSVMKPFYALVANQKEELFLSKTNKYFELFHCRQLWLRAPDSIRMSIWLHAQKICENANLYILCTKCPNSNTITQIAQEFSEKLRRNEFSMADFDIRKVQSLGEHVLNRCSPAEREQFKRYLDDPDNLEEFTDLVSSMITQFRTNTNFEQAMPNLDLSKVSKELKS